jgi:hypothetical protein
MLILFGAGASFGSQQNDVPPLGSELFRSLQEFNPDGWGQISDERALEAFSRDFEEGMEIVLDGDDFKPGLLQRVMAAFFTQFYPSNDSLYVRLGRRIKRKQWDGAIATLNYDRLCQDAFRHCDVSWGVGNSPSHQGVEMIFPHGACNLVVTGVYVRGETAFSASINGGVQLMDSWPQLISRLISNSVPPIMCYYEPSKRFTAGPAFIEKQRKRFAEKVGQSSHIALIGLRVRDRDTHIWEPLKTTPAQLLYCSGSAGYEEFLTWQKTYRPSSEDVALKGYFDDCFDRICEHVGIL